MILKQPICNKKEKNGSVAATKVNPDKSRQKLKNISTKTLLEKKTEQFVAEIGKRKLTSEQERVYNAFVYRRSKPYKFSVNDNYGDTIRFTLYTNKSDDGVIHILTKHYQGRTGSVTAVEILDFCDIIRLGEISIRQNEITYKLKKNNTTYSLIVGLKKTQTGDNVLKSFYSNKKTSRTAGSRA